MRLHFLIGAYRVAVHLKDILQENNMLNDTIKTKTIVEFEDSQNSKEKEKRFYDIIRQSKN